MNNYINACDLCCRIPKRIYALCIHAPTGLYQITEILRKSTCYNKVKLVSHFLK